MTEDVSAFLTPDAENDLLEIDPSATRTVIERMLLGEEVKPRVIADFLEEDDSSVGVQEGDSVVEIEDLADPEEGWSLVRVGGYVVRYRLLTDGERTEQGRASVRGTGGLADCLISRIRPFAEFLLRSRFQR